MLRDMQHKLKNEKYLGWNCCVQDTVTIFPVSLREHYGCMDLLQKGI